MWYYSQRLGTLNQDGVYVAKGYAGHPPHVNDPTAQAIHNVGPLPQGFYTIGAMFDSPSLGPDIMALIPDQDNEMFGRSGFYMHGDNPRHVGFSSDGCIIMAHLIRLQVNNSDDRRLKVTG